MNDKEITSDQITLRDEFAIAIVRGFINETGLWMDDFGEQVYILADKLIEARNK
jgi:hypothetical protein